MALILYLYFTRRHAVSEHQKSLLGEYMKALEGTTGYSHDVLPLSLYVSTRTRALSRALPLSCISLASEHPLI